MRTIQFVSVLLVLPLLIVHPLQAGDNLRVLVIGAHPDDAEKMGGTAAKYVALGHTVQLVSVTNGDAGHQLMGGGPLAERRTKEAQAAGRAIGAAYVVLDNHDGELMPTLENRRTIIKLIREFNPDLLFTHRPNDYHPDHRYTGILVQDAAYMVMVPNIVAGTPAMKKNPVIMFLSDHFTEPSPFKPDIVVAIDDVIEKKIDMYHCHESQMYEWLPWIGGYLQDVPEKREERRGWLANRRVIPGAQRIADQYREKLIELYGKEKGSKVRFAEAFQVSEYGGSLTDNNRNLLFPFFD
jgi:LmbE family N-acetylglucosaminyl deacetylase